MRLTRRHLTRGYINHRREVNLVIVECEDVCLIGERVPIDVKNLLRICFNLNESYIVRTK